MEAKLYSLFNRLNLKLKYVVNSIQHHLEKITKAISGGAFRSSHLSTKQSIVMTHKKAFRYVVVVPATFN